MNNKQMESLIGKQRFNRWLAHWRMLEKKQARRIAPNLSTYKVR